MTTLLPVATGRRTWTVVSDLARGRRRVGAAAVLALAGSSAAGLVVPRVIGHLVDEIVDGAGAGAVTGPTVLLVIVAVIQAGLLAVGNTLFATFGEGVLARLREQVVDRALRLPLLTVERAGSGDLVTRVSGDTTVVGEAVRGAVPELVGALLTVGLTLVGLAALDWRLALAALVVVPVQWAAARWYLRVSTPMFREQRVRETHRTQQLLESVGGAATVRGLGLTDRHVAAVTRRSRDAVELDLAVNVAATRFFGRLNAAECIGLSTILVVAFYLVRADATTVGAAAAAALYFHRLFDPVNVLLGELGTAQEAAAGLTRLVGVADMASAPEKASAPTANDVALRGVGFAYGDHGVLHDVTIEVPSGSRTALVGASGAGKTTLARLLSGDARPASGEVSIGGTPVADLGLDALRGTVVHLTQEVHVFAGTLAEDLRLARAEATDADLTAVLAAVGADWVDRLPDGLETVVGEGGHALSAAQAQQVAFARLLLTDPAVVVLDEATADAGSAGARLLDQVAERALAGRTALIVAHRLTQAQQADRVAVLEHGRLIEHGTHDDLVAAGGTYAGLWRAWSGTTPPTPQES